MTDEELKAMLAEIKEFYQNDLQASKKVSSHEPQTF